jgi:hypothetical protein
MSQVWPPRPIPLTYPTKQEILRYLDYIKEVWYKILRGDRQAMKRVDQASLKVLEFTVPGACTADAEVLWGQLMSGRIFGACSKQDREAIWIEVLSYSAGYFISSLFSFFEDLKYLQGPADCVRRLISLLSRDTVFSVLEQSFSDVNQTPDQCIIQESESVYALEPRNLADHVDFGIRQIWIPVMCNYLEMPAEPKKKTALAKPTGEKADEVVLCELAALAYRLGFDSEEIRCLMQRSPDREIARDALLKAR